MSALVIKHWRAESQPAEDDKSYIRIAGRQGGLIAWILARMGIDPVTTIKVGFERVEFSSASMAGIESRMIPLQNVCSTYYGYHKPWKAALSIALAWLMLVLPPLAPQLSPGKLMAAAAVGLVVAIGYYFLNRTLTLGFVEHSGFVCGIRFKRSVIERIDVNQEQARSVCELMQRLIEAKEKRTLLATR